MAGPPGTDAAPRAAPPGSAGGRPRVRRVQVPDQADTGPGARSGWVGPQLPPAGWAPLRFPASPVEMSLLPTPCMGTAPLPPGSLPPSGSKWAASGRRGGALTVRIRSAQTAEQVPARRGRPGETS